MRLCEHTGAVMARRTSQVCARVGVPLLGGTASRLRRISTPGRLKAGPQTLSIVILAIATASASSPRLASVTPTGAQRGTELEVVFEGERLQDTEEVICHEPDIQVLKIISVTNNVVKAQIKTLPDTRLGEHH